MHVRARAQHKHTHTHAHTHARTRARRTRAHLEAANVHYAKGCKERAAAPVERVALLHHQLRDAVGHPCLHARRRYGRRHRPRPGRCAVCAAHGNRWRKEDLPRSLRCLHPERPWTPHVSPARLCLPARPDARAHKSRPTPYSIPAGHATSSPTERVWRADRPSGGKCVCVCALIARTPALQETRRVHAAVPARRRHGCSPFERSLALACMSGVTHRGREEAREGDGSGPPHTTPQAPLRPRGSQLA